MGSLKPSHAIRADLGEAEVFFAIGGYWNASDMRAFLFDLGEAAKPLMRDRRPFDVIGDLGEFVPQDRETAGAIRETILVGRKNGLRRFAIVAPPPLVKMQYRRLTEGIEVEFFDDVHSARSWLRSDPKAPMPGPIAV